MPEKKPSAVPLRRHAAQQTATLLRRLAYEVGRASGSSGAGTVHDLRVSVRRLAQCLQVFAQFFPRAKAKRIRARLKRMLDEASEVRNRDVAAALLAKAGVAPEAALALELARERREAARQLTADLRHWMRRHSFRKWRSWLEL
jgi:CHAD domain-containing protein